jgi:hypothetical protein
MGHRDGKHVTNFWVAEKKVRVEEERHLIAVRRRTREALFQSPFIHGVFLRILAIYDPRLPLTCFEIDWDQ